MQSLKAFLDSLGINEAAAVAGSFGAALAAARMQAVAMATRLLYFGIGLACALWAPPLIVRVFALPAEPSTYSALGFALGYFGLSLMDAIAEFLAALKKTNWRPAIDAAIKKFTGGGG